MDDILNDAETLDIPLSFAQERLWFLDQLHPRNPLYNVPLGIRIRGVLDCDALKQSIETIIQRHEILRTTYRLKNGSPVQEIHDHFELQMPVLDLSACDVERREGELSAQLLQRSRQPFDLSDDLMVRSALFKLSDEEHLLFLNIHHIACDEWSMGIFARELALLYPAYSRNQPAQLPELPVQYADFAIWQRESVDDDALQRQLLYWKERLSGELPVLELPTDYPPPTQLTFDGDRVRHRFSRELSERIKTRCHEKGITPFIFVVAAFKVLLHRYTGQEDILIGTPIAGRTRMETEELIGFFVNTLVLRSRVTGSQTFEDYLQQIREVALGAFSNQDVPFENLVTELQPDRNAAQNPIFNVMFVLQNEAELPEIPGLQLSLEEIDTRTSKFALTVGIQDGPEGFVAAAEFSTALFRKDTISQLLVRLETILEAVVANPLAQIAQVPLLSIREQKQLLAEWNQTKTEFPNHAPIHELFAHAAAQRPGQVAARFGRTEVTYRELDERSNQLAHYLKKFGVGPDVLVGICVERSIEMLVGWLGILKAGGAYVPLDPGYPPERLQFMFEDARMPVLLTESKLVGRLPDDAVKVCLDSDWEQIARDGSRVPLPSGSTAENLAYVIYTSGSTGKPKGVAVPHRAIARLVFNTNYIQLDATDRIAQASNSSFDAATFEVWGALLHGGCLVGIPQNVLLSPMDLAKQLRENGITAIFLTTALFNQVAIEVPDAFCSVKHVLFGGEACDPKCVKQVLQHGPPERLLHVYGPTETTTFASWFEVKEVPDGATTIPIGRPLSNTTFYVLDRNLQPVPAGIPGELYIGGDGLARGYHCRPELTAARFIENPFVAGERLYRTGDLVRWLPDGCIEFVGRIDNQVKIRGFRIELEEIEIALRQTELVRDAVVTVRSENGGNRLVAYVVPQDSGVTTEDIRLFLKTKVPDFMLPSAFVFLPALPLTPNGKVDRRALPAPPSNKSKARESDLPRNNLENQLAKIWEAVLGIKPIGIYDNFFELGGHSLLAVRLFTRIEQLMGQKLPLSTLFQAPTIEGLARVMSQKSWSAPGASLVEIQPEGTRAPMFWLHTLGGGGGGGLFVYRKLAELLGPDQPSYGLVTPPEPFKSIEKMAAHYISELKTIQPNGPYHIGGYCFGGVIAFEMARQLAVRGEQVGLLALIESLPPNVPQPSRLSPAMAAHVIKTFPRWIAAQTKKGPRELAVRVGRKLAGAWRHAAGRFASADDAQSPEQHMARVRNRINEIIDFTHYPEHYKRYAEVHWVALDRYQPREFSGRIHLFRTAHARLFQFDTEQIWAQLCSGGVQTHVIPGTHEKILETPNVEYLAAEMRQALGIQIEQRQPLPALDKMVGEAA